MSRALISVVGAATDSQIIAAPGAGKTLRILRIHFTVSLPATVSVTDGADGATTRLLYGDFGAYGGMYVDSYSLGHGLLYPVAILTGNTALKMTNSAGNLKGVVEYDTVST